MKKYLATVVSVSALVATSAMAADLPSIKSAPVAPAPQLWTGAYAGMNIGYGFGIPNGTNTSSYPLVDNWDDAQQLGGTKNWKDSSQGIILGNNGGASITQQGVIGGGQLGYNFQLRERYVVGAEIDIQGTGITGNGTSFGAGRGELDLRTRSGQADIYSRYVAGSNLISASVDWLGTVRARAGYLITPTLLAYGTGGFTYGGISLSTNPSALVQYKGDPTGNYYGYQGAVGYRGKANTVGVGWNAGGGFEWMFMPNWSVKTEAIYYSLGSQTVMSYTYAPAYRLNTVRTGDWLTQNRNQLSYNGIIARAGVNYHFNLGSIPVVAKF